MYSRPSVCVVPCMGLLRVVGNLLRRWRSESPQGLVLGLVPVPERAGRAARGARRCHAGLPWFGFIKRTAQLVRTRTLQAQPSYSPLAP